MNKVLVAVFDSEDKARAALGALESLADADTIRVNASAIVSKSPGGAITVSRTVDAAKGRRRQDAARAGERARLHQANGGATASCDAVIVGQTSSSNAP